MINKKLIALSVACGLGLLASTASAATAPKPTFSPFIDFVAWPPPQIDTIGVTNGIQQFILGFVVAGIEGGAPVCKASWGAVLPVPKAGDPASSDQLATLEKSIKAYRTKGGEIAISFGGNNNTPLATACATNESLQAVYQQVIDRYQPAYIDFDIENAATKDPVSLDRRFQVTAALQKQAKAKGGELKVILTLPTMENGMTDGIDVVRRALLQKVDISYINVMAMDYGHTVSDMGQATKDAAQSLYGQLKQLYQDAGITISDAQLWGKVGMTPMIGANDSFGETFTLENARDYLAFSEQQGVGMNGMWAAGRDFAGNLGEVGPHSSGIAQADYAFTQIFVNSQHWGTGVTRDEDYEGGGGTGCKDQKGESGYFKWCSKAYQGGAEVDYKGIGYRAAYYAEPTQIPGESEPWAKIGAGPDPKPDPKPEPGPDPETKPTPEPKPKPEPDCDSDKGPSGNIKWCATTDHYAKDSKVDLAGAGYEAQWYANKGEKPGVSDVWKKTSGPDQPGDLIWSPNKNYPTVYTVVELDGVQYRNKWYANKGQKPGNDPVWEQISGLDDRTWSPKKAYAVKDTLVILDGVEYSNQWYANPGDKPGVNPVWKRVN